MELRWKIFRIANIVQIVLTAIILVSAVTVVSGKNYDAGDIIGLIICTLVTIIVSLNGISNLLVLRPATYQKTNTLPSKTRFWLLTILFLLTCLFIIICIIAFISTLNEIGNQHRREHIGMIIMISWFSVLAINGIYIFIQQIQFFSSRRRELQLQDDMLIDELGEELQ